MERKWSDEREKWERAKRIKEGGEGGGERENVMLCVLDLTYLVRKYV